MLLQNVLTVKTQKMDLLHHMEPLYRKSLGNNPTAAKNITEEYVLYNNNEGSMYLPYMT